jgi:hypothetical protein
MDEILDLPTVINDLINQYADIFHTCITCDEISYECIECEYCDNYSCEECDFYVDCCGKSLSHNCHICTDCYDQDYNATDGMIQSCVICNESYFNCCCAWGTLCDECEEYICYNCDSDNKDYIENKIDSYMFFKVAHYKNCSMHIKNENLFK